MRSVLVIDRSFAARERGMLSRLEIGLADEGVRVAHAVPYPLAGRDMVGLYSTVVGYADRGLPFTLKQRATILSEQLRSALDLSEDEDVEIVHVLGDGFRSTGGVKPTAATVGAASAGWNTSLIEGVGWMSAGIAGGGSWGMALQLARRLGAGLVVEVWAGHLIASAVQLESKARRLGVETTYLAVDDAIEAGLKSKLGGACRGRVVSSPWGVHVRREFGERYWATGGDGSGKDAGETRRCAAVAVLASGSSPRILQAIMEGLNQIGKELIGGVLVFVGADERIGDTVWRHGRRLGMFDRLTLVPEMESQREPILAMDVLIVPGKTGVHRSLVLDALGSGMAVVSGPDGLVSYLNDEGIVERVMTPTNAAAWSGALERVLTDRALSVHKTESARAWIESSRAASRGIGVVLKAYGELAERRRKPRVEAREQSAGMGGRG